MHMSSRFSESVQLGVQRFAFGVHGPGSEKTSACIGHAFKTGCHFTMSSELILISGASLKSPHFDASFPARVKSFQHLAYEISHFSKGFQS